MATNDCIGSKGRKSLREALLSASSEDIAAAVENFQQQNAILVPSLKSALGLYDLFGVPRQSYYSTAAESLRDKFVEHLRQLNQPVSDEMMEKLNDYLLRYTRLCVDVPFLQPILFSAAMALPSLSEEVIEKLVESSIFEVCPIELRQKIFEQRPVIFRNTVFRLVAAYINAIEASFRSAKICGHSSKLSADVVNLLRKHSSVTQIADIVGQNAKLYASVHSILDEVFEETENDIVCTMKSSIILAVAGSHEGTLRTHEPFYKLCWCLDTSVRQQHFEAKQLKQLHSICESVKDIGTLSILLADPLFVDLATKKLVAMSNSSLQSETLMRNMNNSQFLVYLLKLGNHNLLVRKNFRGFQEMVDFSCYFDYCAALSVLTLSSNDSSVEKPSESYITKTAHADVLCWELLLHYCQNNPSVLPSDSLVGCLPSDGITDSILFELLWTVGGMLKLRPSSFLDTISALLAKASSKDRGSADILSIYTMRLFDLGISLLESALIHQLPAIIECIRNTISTLDELDEANRDKLLTFFDSAAERYDVV